MQKGRPNHVLVSRYACKILLKVFKPGYNNLNAY